MPSALRGGQGAGGAGGSAGCRGLSLDDAFGGAADESLLLLESRLHRPHTHACQVRSDWRACCTPQAQTASSLEAACQADTHKCITPPTCFPTDVTVTLTLLQ